MTKILPSQPPFEKYKVYGPYSHCNEERQYVTLVKSRFNRTSMSYARYLMCVKLERILTKEEEVDHTDKDKSNDHIDNLQILTPKENRDKSRKTRQLITMNCFTCGKEFSRPKNHSNDKTKFCSRPCLWEYLRS